MNKFLILFATILLFSFTNITQAKLPPVEKGKPLPSDLFVELAKLINPTVVNISTSQLPRQRRQQRDPYFDMLEQFFGVPGGGQMFQNRQPRNSLGTGFIIRSDGLIITNNHVIDKADVIKVQLSENDEKLFDAQVIGKDARTDIALIKIKTNKKLPVAKLGSSKSLEVGEWVAAFGNPYGHGHTMTKGILSAIGRNINELNRFSFLQTDASINPGNSGGPLVNTKGEVIGVNTAIDARAQGIGFAIPIDDVKTILPQLEKDGGVKRGYIGIYMDNLNPKTAQALKLKVKSGVMVIRVIDGSPAEKAKVKEYDVITEFNGKKIASVNALIRAVADTPVGKTVPLKINRSGKLKALKIKIAEHPEQRLTNNKKVKKYQGQKAPFNVGFKIANMTPQISRDWRLPKLREKHPVVIDVTKGSAAYKAGLQQGDIILDVNRKVSRWSTDVIKSLKKKSTNIVRVLRGNTVLLVQLDIK